MNNNKMIPLQQMSMPQSFLDSTKTEVNDEFKLQPLPHNYKKYGNMKVLIQTQSILITLGPDYPCFLGAFLMFTVGAVFIIIYVNNAFENVFVKIGNAVFTITQLVSYLLVALSNPGIVLKQHMNTEQNIQQDIKRFCKVCHLKMERNVHHCRYCGVCIKDYDHHCPWTSKCIGGSNLKRFYFFVGITPIYMMYYMLMMLVSLAIVSSQETK